MENGDELGAVKNLLREAEMLPSCRCGHMPARE
jgi:hypothetical protein